MLLQICDSVAVKSQKIWKKTFPFQLKFNRFPTFHYVRGWFGYDWSLVSCLQTLLHCRRGCCRFCSLSRFSLALLLIYTVAIRCYWCSRWTEACKSASAQKAVPSRFLEVNFRSNTCRCGCRCRPQFFAPPHRLVQDRCFYPADLFQVVDFTAQSRPFFRPISKISFFASYSNGGGKKGCKVTWQKDLADPQWFRLRFLGPKRSS